MADPTLSQFRKKTIEPDEEPVIVDAFQWQGEDVPGCYRQIIGYNTGDINHDPIMVLRIPCCDGPVPYFFAGDFIMTDPNGRPYGCRWSHFVKEYEPIDGPWDFRHESTR